MLRKFVSILVILLLLCCLTTVSMAATASVVTEEQRLNNEIVANEQYQNLLAGLSNESKARNASTNYYGGAYINDDGNLVVCVTTNYNEHSGAIQAYTNNEDIILKTVEYPYNTLLQEQNNIAKTYEALCDVSLPATVSTATVSESSDAIELICSSLCGTYIDEENNMLVVEIEGLSTEKINAFESVFSDAEYIVFVEGQRAVETATALNGGERIYSPRGEGASVGYPAHYTSSDGSLSVYGFITAGHAFVAGDYVYASDGTTVIGYCELSHGGRADAAFIWVTNPNYYASAVTNYSGITLNTSSPTVPAQGTTIYKEGATSGYTYGQVVSTSVTKIYSSGVIYYDLIQTTALNLRGDSGGVAYTGTGVIVGTMSGSSHTGEELTSSTFRYSYIAKAVNALEVLYCDLS